MLNKREIAKKKKLASQYKGISYRADDDVFVVRVRTGTDLTGKPIYFLPVKRYTEFNKALKRFDEVKALINKGIVKEDKFTFEELHDILKEYLEETEGDQLQQTVGQAFNTINAYIKPLNVMETIAPNIYVKSITEVTEEEIIEFLTKWSQTTSPKKKTPPKKENVNGQFGGIWRALTSKAYKKIQDELKSKNIDVKALEPILKCKLEIVTTRKIDDNEDELIYTYEEVKQLWKAITNFTEKANRKNAKPVARLCFMLQILTGTRISEVIGLKKSDFMRKPIEEGRYCIKISKQKKGKGAIKLTKTDSSKRIIPIPRELYTLFMTYADSNNIKDNDYIFSRWNTLRGCVEDYDTRALTKYFDDFEAEAGIKHISQRASHGFRHTVITYFGKSGAGVDRQILQKFCGHKDMDEDKSTEAKVYESKKPTAIDFIHFMAAQRAYMECLTKDMPLTKLPGRYEYYIKFINEEIRIKNEEENNLVELVNEEGDLRDSANLMFLLIDELYSKYIKQKFLKMPRKEREEININQFLKAELDKFDEAKYDFIYKFKTIQIKKLLNGHFKEVPIWLMNEVADSKAYKEFYYNNALSEGYKEGNSFEDFLNDLKEGHILIRFGASFEERNDKKYIMEFCKEIVKNPKLFEPIFLEKYAQKSTQI